MSGESPSPSWRFEHFELLPAERTLRVDGEPVAVGGRAFDLLLVLARHADRVVSKSELLDEVWPGLVVEEHNIATQVASLRKLLGAQAIGTVAGRGYRLTAARAAAPDRASAPPAPVHRHNLPNPRTRFIGREAALSSLARLLPAARLLTLTGIGGCGKTRLALRLAQEQLAAYPDGVWFVDLAPLNDAERVCAACAEALGLRDKGSDPVLARLIAQLANRRLLLVLDNCEHVLDGVVPFVDALLADAGGVQILATSREALGVAGEQIVPVRSLSLPATQALPAVLGAESARVFADRARLAQPDFAIDAGNAAAVADICRRLDGIALALELAAARVPMLSVAQIAERLDDRFRLLTGGHRALPRHQTLQAAMQWSHELLSAREQSMLHRLAVFAGGWTLDAAAAVAQTADEYDALALLTALHDKSLLIVERDRAEDPPRYRMLETVRQYALARLVESGQAEAVRTRHAMHFLGLAEQAHGQIHGPAQDAWMSRFRLEHENLVAALRWCIDGPLDAQVGLRLADASAFYWVWNSVELGRRLAGAMLARDRAAVDTPARIGTLASIAKLSLFRGQYEESLAHAEAALAGARRLGSPQVLAEALDMAGSALLTVGRLDDARRCHEEALAIARERDDDWLCCALLNSLGEGWRAAGRLDAADLAYRESLDIAHRLEGRYGIAVILNNLIRVQVALDRPAEARRFARECLPLVRHENVGVDLLEASVGLAAAQGEHAYAARLWGAADRTLRLWGYSHQPVDTEHTARWIAVSQRALGDDDFGAAEAQGRTLEFDAAMAELAQWLATPS